MLARLAVEIRASVNTSTTAAIEAGRKLIEAKALLRHGQWLPWLHKHVEMTERVAQYHMQLAATPNPSRVSDLPIRTALEVVRGEEGQGRRRSDDRTDDAQRRRGPVSVAHRPPGCP